MNNQESKKNNTFQIDLVMDKISVSNYRVLGEGDGNFEIYSSLFESKSNSVTFCTNKTSVKTVSNKVKEREKLINSCNASVILVQEDIDFGKLSLSNKKIVIVKDPKLSFVKILSYCFPPHVEFKIDSTATIHPKAQISGNVFIGANCVVGKSKISENTIIHSNVVIDDKVTIGKNVIIHPGCVIGFGGFQFVRDDDEKLTRFNHYGGVTIEDNVEILTLTNIEKGTFSDTVLKAGCKIDNLCHIGHNCVIGENTAITACTVVGGSSKIGSNSYIGLNCTIRDGISVGENVVVGMGAVVTKDVPPKSTVVGNPAIPLDDFKLLNKKLKDLN